MNAIKKKSKDPKFSRHTEKISPKPYSNGDTRKASFMRLVISAATPTKKCSIDSTRKHIREIDSIQRRRRRSGYHILVSQISDPMLMQPITFPDLKVSRQTCKSSVMTFHVSLATWPVIRYRLCKVSNDICGARDFDGTGIMD